MDYRAKGRVIMARTPISKTLRFSVFKRDSFTCQYCGKMAPDVILEVDHINPVSKNGSGDILNLITSCYDCNRGKGQNY
jgi:5-methylcytosine-specific restriction endonuclease McrA